MIDGLDDDAIVQLLAGARCLAVVGASPDPARPSHGVTHFLVSAGYRVTPVNPSAAGVAIAGQTAVASLADCMAPIDIVDIFRNSAAALGIVREAIALKDALAIRAVWMQLGVVNETAAEEARRAGLVVVMDRCPKIEWARLGSEIQAARAAAR